jgi:site-specific DNA-methyltransferase (adenine-specific)
MTESAIPLHPRHRLVFGDSRTLSAVGDGEAHLVVTSPPYWEIKNYGHVDQIGFSQSYEDYINDLNLVWQECFRALAPGGRLCINIGDQFVRAADYGRFKVMPIHAEIVKFCESINLDYMGSIIWQKVTTTKSSGGGAVMGSFPYPRNGVVKLDYEFILIFRKPGATPAPSAAAKAASVITTSDWNEMFVGHWVFGGARQIGHIAMFPEELPTRLIKMFSFVDEVVLDPFVGSGTTMLAAAKLGRRSIGYEINPDFESMILDKLEVVSGAEMPLVLGKQPLSVERWTPSDQASIAARKDSWNYRFRDFDATVIKKVHEKTKSKQEFEDAPRKRIKQPLSPTSLLAEDGTVVRLVGLEANGYDEAAMGWLVDRVVGRTVVLLSEPGTQDVEGEMNAFVHLDNHTFINGHLLRTGLVKVSRDASDATVKRLAKFSKQVNEHGESSK